MSKDYPVPYVKVDDERASYAATEYLLKQGHRRIAMIAGSPGRSDCRHSEDYGLPICTVRSRGEEGTKELIIPTQDFSYESGIMAMKKIVDHPLECNGRFCEQ